MKHRNTRLDDDTDDALERFAAANDLQPSAAIRKATQRGLEAEGYLEPRGYVERQVGHTTALLALSAVLAAIAAYLLSHTGYGGTAASMWVTANSWALLALIFAAILWVSDMAPNSLMRVIRFSPLEHLRQDNPDS